MRIISGRLKGRILRAPKNSKIRPTTDMAKEGLFNILHSNIDFTETSVLDLFSGTGNISYEFGSRGCPAIIAVELDRRACRFIHQTKETLELPIRVVQNDVYKFLRNTSGTFDIIFADPPYEQESIAAIIEITFERKLLTPDGWLILEHAKNRTGEFGNFKFTTRKYGKVNFSIFKQADQIK